MILFLSLTAKLFLSLIMGDDKMGLPHTHKREIAFVSRCYVARSCCNAAGPIPNPPARNAYDERVIHDCIRISIWYSMHNIY
jgi:hypothetical protein